MVGKSTKVAVMLLLSVTYVMADEFRVTAFSVGETSVCFSVAWPVSQIFPDGTIDVLYHPTLMFEVDTDGELDTWWHAREVPVIQSLGIASFEVSFGDLVGIAPDEIGACFFLLRISDIGGILVGGSGGQDEGGEPPDPTTDTPAHTGSAEWMTLTGALGAGIEATLDETFEVFPGQTYVFVVYSYSTEFPNWTSSQSQYDDVLTWDVSLPDDNTLSGSLHVNSRHNDWLVDQANGVSAQGYSPVHVEDVAVVNIPNDAAIATGSHALLSQQAQTVAVHLTAKNVSDGALPSTVMVAKFPLKLVQSNRPNSDRVAFSSTDFGTRGTVEIGVGTKALAYITGEPAAPQLTVRLDGAPKSFSVDWRMTMTSERPERGTLDDRSAPAGGGWGTVAGDEAWNITEALSDEIVGGKCTLFIRPQGQSQASAEFRIRAKNPMDADAEAYLQSEAIDAEFRSFAWLIVRHESSQNKPGTIAAYRYNQFNTGGVFSCLPNKTANKAGTGTGWGMVQIDRGNNQLITTAEAWDWKANVRTMNTVLQAKLNTYIQQIGYYRNEFGPTGIHPSVHWSEPPALYTLDNVTQSSTIWAVMTLYNGRGGLPTRKLTGQATGFRCPLWFNENDGTWMLKQNQHSYTKRIAADIINPPNTVEE